MCERGGGVYVAAMRGNATHGRHVEFKQLFVWNHFLLCIVVRLDFRTWFLAHFRLCSGIEVIY